MQSNRAWGLGGRCGAVVGIVLLLGTGAARVAAAGPSPASPPVRVHVVGPDGSDEVRAVAHLPNAARRTRSSTVDLPIVNPGAETGNLTGWTDPAGFFFASDATDAPGPAGGAWFLDTTHYLNFADNGLQQLVDISAYAGQIADIVFTKTYAASAGSATFVDTQTYTYTYWIGGGLGFLDSGLALIGGAGAIDPGADPATWMSRPMSYSWLNGWDSMRKNMRYIAITLDGLWLSADWQIGDPPLGSTFTQVPTTTRWDEMALTLVLCDGPCRYGNRDTDGDGDVDLLDYASWLQCFAGPDVLPNPPPPFTTQDCLDHFDVFGDNDVDLADLAVLQTEFTGPTAAPNPGAIVGWGDHIVGVDMSGPFLQVAPGPNHSLGLKTDGSLVAWGSNGNGELNIPAPNAGFVSVAGGGAHSLGLKDDGSIVAWGGNGDGQCDVPAPNTGFTAVAAGASHSLGLLADGSIVAWGNNVYGQCDVPAPNTGFTAIAAGAYHSLGLKTDGTIVAWGNNGDGECNVPAPNADFTAVAAGAWQSYGLRADGSIAAWGNNGNGQCDVPVPNTNFVAVTGGGYHTLGLKADGAIVAWGWDGDGECSVPPPNTDFAAVAACGNRSLGLKADGSLVTWGTQANVRAPNADFVAVAASPYHGLGLKADGSIVIWGDDNWYGGFNIPEPNAGFAAVAAGEDFRASNTMTS